MINNNFIYGLGDLAVGTAVNIPSHMAFGSTQDVLSASDIITSGEISRSSLDSKTRTQNVIKFVKLKTGATSTSTPINSIGLWNSSTGGQLWSNMLTSSLIQTTSFDIDFEIWIQILGQ